MPSARRPGIVGKNNGKTRLRVFPSIFPIEIYHTTATTTTTTTTTAVATGTTTTTTSGQLVARVCYYYYYYCHVTIRLTVRQPGIVGKTNGKMVSSVFPTVFPMNVADPSSTFSSRSDSDP